MRNIKNVASSIVAGLLLIIAADFNAMAQQGPDTAQPVHPLERQEGLKRFDKSTRFQAAEPSLAQHSSWDIKDVRIADNILAKAIELSEQGGSIHTITGGSRSEKITFSFFQPYQEARLEQRLDLHFNKLSGFITQINLRYFLSSAYLSIEPLRPQILSSAISKYGKPLTLQTIRGQLRQPAGDVRLSRYLDTLKPDAPAAHDYLKKRNLSRNAIISSDENGYALLHFGFDQCYLWPTDEFNELLTFCAFAPQAANANNRGLEFSLINFSLQQAINEQPRQLSDKPSLSL